MTDTNKHIDRERYLRNKRYIYSIDLLKVTYILMF